MIVLRNEKYGGTSFNQINGDFLRFNHDLLKILLKTNMKMLTAAEQGIIEFLYPRKFQKSKIENSLFKEKVLSPYESPIVSNY